MEFINHCECDWLLYNIFKFYVFDVNFFHFAAYLCHLNFTSQILPK